MVYRNAAMPARAPMKNVFAQTGWSAGRIIGNVCLANQIRVFSVTCSAIIREFFRDIRRCRVARSFHENGDFVQRLLSDVWNPSVVGRKSDGNEKVGFLIWRPIKG